MAVLKEPASRVRTVGSSRVECGIGPLPVQRRIHHRGHGLDVEPAAEEAVERLGRDSRSTQHVRVLQDQQVDPRTFTEEALDLLDLAPVVIP
jgi:hypothetical protein